MKRAPRSALAAEDMTAFIIIELARTAPLFGGSAELFDMNIFRRHDSRRSIRRGAMRRSAPPGPYRWRCM